MTGRQSPAAIGETVTWLLHVADHTGVPIARLTVHPDTAQIITHVSLRAARDVAQEFAERVGATLEGIRDGVATWRGETLGREIVVHGPAPATPPQPEDYEGAINMWAETERELRAAGARAFMVTDTHERFLHVIAAAKRDGFTVTQDEEGTWCVHPADQSAAPAATGAD